MNPQRGSRQVNRRLMQATFEALEQRRMLTTVGAGQIFEFIQTLPEEEDGQLVRVRVEDPAGKAKVELIGASVIPGTGPGGQTAVLAQIPGSLDGEDVFGGVGGADGVEHIGVVTGDFSGTDLDFTNIGGPNLVARNGAIHYDAMSSNGNGTTYALTLEVIGEENVVGLINVDYRGSGDGVVIQDLAGAMVGLTGAEGTDSIQQIIAADYLASDNTKMLFAAVINVDRPSLDGGDPSGTDVPFLFLYDFAAADPVDAVQLIGAFRSDPQRPAVAENTPDLFHFTVDSNDNIVAYVTGRQVQGVGDDQDVVEATGLVTIPFDPDNPSAPVFTLDDLVTVTLNGDPIDIRGLESIPGDDGFIYAISGEGDDAILVHVDTTNGVAINYGGLPDPDDGAAPQRGQELSDLVWNARLPNFFQPNEDGPVRRGTLIAQDTASDEMVVINAAPRYPTSQLFSVHITDASVNTTVSISAINDAGEEIPFEGSAGAIRHTNAQTGLIVESELPAGQVFIGARTLDIFDDVDNEQNIPFRRVRKTPAQEFGAFPNDAKYVYAGISSTSDVGNVLIGGTLTGRVAMEGSIAGVLHANGILTGDPNGRLESSSYADVKGNFYVGGDARNITSLTSFGSTDASGDAPIYLTGSDVVVGGKLGQLLVLSSLYGNVAVDNSYKGLNLAVRELEDTDWLGASFENDTADTAQYVGSHFSRALGNDESVIINGSLSSVTVDPIDNYNIALMAGQTITVQLDSRLATMNVGIFDPDGRLVATDYSDLGAGVVSGKAFQFKVDRPGIYRFSIAGRTDTAFTGTVGGSGYTLRVSNIADVALGGLVAGVDFLSYEQTLEGSAGVSVTEGDLGAVVSKTSSIQDTTADHAYQIGKGNVRAIQAVNIGVNTGTGIDLLVPRGDVGLIRNTGATMRLNENLPMIDTLTDLPDPTVAVGGDIQWIDSTGAFTGSLSAKRAIGNIHADNFSGAFIIVNADRKGNDGIVDLADISGNLSGTDIYTGPGGNFRYLRVAGTLSSPDAFGGVQVIEPTIYDAGVAARLVDDSGVDVKITPTPQVRDTSFGGTAQLLNPGTLQILAYPVADSDKNGVIITRVDLDPAGAVANHGLLIETGTDDGVRGNGGVEIGEINLNSTGRTITQAADPTTGIITITVAARRAGEGINVPPDLLSPVDVIMKGPATIDVLDLSSTGTIDSIENRTAGELVNITATNIADISAETIGLAQGHTGVGKHRNGNAVLGGAALDGALGGPALGQRNAVQVSGILRSARARQGLGNIWVTGLIGSIVPNSNGRNVKGVHEGINGPIVALGQGRILNVDIGEGLLPSGTGTVPQSGLFAGTQIDSIIGRSADIRGDIIVGFAGTPTGTGASAIGSIELNGGAIINADIGVVDNVALWQEPFSTVTGFTGPEIDDTVRTPVFEIGELTLEGNGGIIGSTFRVADMGPIKIAGGFGFINSTIDFPSTGTAAGIDTTGYGIRDSQVFGGTIIQSIVARGTGKRIATTSFTPSVRQSQGKEGFDPYTGQQYNELNDLHRYLGTSEKTPKIKGISNDGIIEDSQFAAGEELGRISAYRILGRQRTTRVQFGNQIREVNVTDVVDRLQLSTGRLRSFRTGNNITNSLIGVAGQLDSMNIGGTLKGTTTVRVTGAQGRLIKLETKRGLFGTVSVVNNVGSIRVGTDLGSSLTRGLANIDTLNVGGSILSGARVRFENGTMTNLTVAGDIQEDAVVAVKSLTNQSIGGDIFGDIVIG